MASRRCICHLRIPFMPPPPLERQGLDSTHPVNGLDQMGTLLLLRLHDLVIGVRQWLKEQEENHEDATREREHQQGKAPLQHEKCGDKAEQRHGLEKSPEQLAGEEVANLPHTVDLARDQSGG